MNHKMSFRADADLLKVFVDPVKDEILSNIKDALTRGAAETVLDWVEEYFSVDEVYDEGALDEWALKNGYKKDEE